MVKASMRMTSHVPLVAAVVLLILQIFSPAPIVMFVLVVLLGILAVSYVWASQMTKGISLQRQRRYGWAQVGDVIEERFIMHNDSLFPLLWAELRDMSDLPGYNASRAIGLGARNSTRWTTEGVCERRGIYTLGPIYVQSGDPFGLFSVSVEHLYTETFVVYPPVAALPPLLEPYGMARGSARTNVRSLDLTTNASSVRHYVPGDALNRIHWRSTARRSTSEQEDIFVKEFDLEPSGDVWITLDLDAQVQAGEDIESTEEYGVVLAASLAHAMLRDNHAVGLIAYGKEPTIIRPQKGQLQLWEILRVLAGVHAVSESSLGQVIGLIEPVVGRGMSMAIITPSTNPEWIKTVGQMLRHGIHVTTLLLDAKTFGGEGETRGVVSALADLGIIAHTIGQGFTFDIISEKRKQRPQYKTLGTGRVVVVDGAEGAQTQWVPVGQDQG